MDMQIEAQIKELADLLKAEGNRKWEIGRKLIYLIDEKHLKMLHIAERCKAYGIAKLSRPSLIDCKEVVKAYKTQYNGLSFYAHLNALNTAKRLKLDPLAVLKRQEAQKDTYCLQPRPMTSKLAKEMGKRAAQKAADDAASYFAKNITIIDRPHHGDWRQIAKAVRPESIHFAPADPPYGQYERIADGRLDSNSTPCRSDQDNASEADALSVTLPLFEVLPPLMARGKGWGGCLGLWQADFLLRPQIIEAAEANGWDKLIMPFHWLKGKIVDNKLALRTQAGRYDDPYFLSCETMWLFFLKGFPPRNCDLSSRCNVRVYEPVRMDGAKPLETHMFQKPDCLADDVVCKLTHPHEMLFEPFGCSGAFSRAAIRNGRHWIYCESNDNNYAFGSAKIHAAMAADQKTVKRVS